MLTLPITLFYNVLISRRDAFKGVMLGVFPLSWASSFTPARHTESLHNSSHLASVTGY